MPECLFKDWEVDLTYSVNIISILFFFFFPCDKATVLEEMPPFPERESSILAKLKKKKGPGTVTDLEEIKKERSSDMNGSAEPASVNASAVVSLKSVLTSLTQRVCR